MNKYAWLSRCAVLLALVGCGGTDEPADTSPPADAGDTGTGTDSGGDAAPDSGSDAAPDAAPDGGGCPDLDDGVGCTLDTCVDGVAEHSPDDSACDSFAGGPVCDAMGRITEDVGICDPIADCMAETQILEDCTDSAPTAACSGSAATGDLVFSDAVGICDEGSATPACGQAAVPCETTTPPSCTEGVLTTATPTCDASAGCGESVAAADCEARPNRCEGPTYIEYIPSCTDATSCVPLGTEERMACPTPATSCVAKVHTTWAATCDPATGCGSTPLIETDCGAMEVSTCAPDGRSGSRVFCRCDPATGCSCSAPRLFVCASGACCVPT